MTDNRLSFPLARATCPLFIQLSVKIIKSGQTNVNVCSSCPELKRTRSPYHWFDEIHCPRAFEIEKETFL